RPWFATTTRPVRLRDHRATKNPPAGAADGSTGRAAHELTVEPTPQVGNDFAQQIFLLHVYNPASNPGTGFGAFIVVLLCLDELYPQTRLGAGAHRDLLFVQHV